MKHETKAALRDRQARIDASVSKTGQQNATRYLNSRPVSNGRIREAIATALFLALTAMVLVIALAL